MFTTVKRNPSVLICLNETSSRVWRVFPNFAYLQDRGWEVIRIEANEPIPDESIERADIIFQQMGLSVALPKRVHGMPIIHRNFLLSRKKPWRKTFIYDIDDLVHKPPKNHPDFSKLSRPVIRFRTWNTIHQSDILITSNQYLHNHYKWALPKEAHIFGNYMDLGYWEKKHRPNNDGTIRIGWCGSPAHWEDLHFIEPVITKLIQEFPQVRFIYCGYGGQRSNRRPDFEYQVGKDIFSLIPDNRREYVMGVPWESWPSKLNSLQLDIGLAPVIENKFGKAKTPIKWMEYAINRVPCVASQHLYGTPYIRHLVDGMAVPNDSEAWFTSLRSLILDESWRRKMGEAAYQRVRQDFNMKDHVGRWANIIERSLRYNQDFASTKRSGC